MVFPKVDLIGMWMETFFPSFYHGLNLLSQSIVNDLFSLHIVSEICSSLSDSLKFKFDIFSSLLCLINLMVLYYIMYYVANSNIKKTPTIIVGLKNLHFYTFAYLHNLVF